jgi:hypothetical protein
MGGAHLAFRMDQAGTIFEAHIVRFSSYYNIFYGFFYNLNKIEKLLVY